MNRFKARRHMIITPMQKRDLTKFNTIKAQKTPEVKRTHFSIIRTNSAKITLHGENSLFP